MRSLTGRLVLTAVLLVAVAALLLGGATTLAMRSTLLGRLDEQVHATLVRADEQRSDLGVGPGRFEGDGTLAAQFVSGGEPVGFVVTAPADGEGPLEQHTLDAEALAALGDLPVDDGQHTVDIPGLGRYRLEAVDARFIDRETGQSYTGVAVAGLPTAGVDETLTRLVAVEALLALLVTGAAALAGAIVVRRQLAPLREVADTAHQVAGLPLDSGEVDLSPRVPEPDERTEVGRVGAAMNTLLAHVESSLTARHASEQQVRRFVADASHELRTPLATIRGYAELSRRTPDDADALSASMVKVSTEADRMTSLVDDLLLLARLDAGRPLVTDEVDVTRLLLESVADARVLAPDHHWRLDLPEDVLTVAGDEQRLHQVVTNLLTNARRHTPAGTTVTVGGRRSGDHLVVRVADDGPGFPPELASSAFERFSRGDAARTRASGGAGLGLSIVDAIVRAHGGRVVLVSAPGDTRIEVLLPLRRQSKKIGDDQAISPSTSQART